MNSKIDKPDNDGTDDLDLEDLLEQRAKLDSILKKKFIKQIAVMFTDLKDSTSLAESKGDLAVRLLIKHLKDMMVPIIEKNGGVLVKTIGDGTLSYFQNAQNATQAAILIQRSIYKSNIKKKDNTVNIRIGLHTGSGIVEHDDIFGDVVNVAARFVSLAQPGEIYLSEDTYNALKNKNVIYCQFVETTNLKGKKDTFKIFKAFWNEKEIENELVRTGPCLLIRKGENLTKMIPLSHQEILIGRSDKCDITLEGQYTSRKHAKLFFKNDFHFIEDLQSQMGVTVNGKAIAGKQRLKNRDKIVIGDTSMTFISHELVEEPTKLHDNIPTPQPKEKASKEHSAPGRFKLIILSNKEKIIEKIITTSGIKIGRHKTNTISLNDKMVSRHHAQIWYENDKIYVEDLGSRNGTYVDGEKISRSIIPEEKEIRISSYRLFVIDAAKEFSPQS